MAYHLYLFGVEWPELPSSFVVKSGGKNKTIDLLDGRTINILKSPGLKEIALTLTLPERGQRPASFFLSRLARYMQKKQTTQLILTRATPGGIPLEDVNLKVSIESYTDGESASAPMEKQVVLNLKEYVDYGTKTIKITTVTENAKTQTVAKVEKERETKNAPKAKTYTVKVGDTLWSIAAKYLGSGAKYTDLFNANKSQISNPNIIHAGQVLTIP